MPPLALSVLIACRLSISAPPGASLRFPVGPHPRQERGGARLSQHGVTAPDDGVGYVDLEGNHQVGDQDSFPPEAGYRAGFTIPVWEWPEQARHGASAPCLGAVWIPYNDQKLMTAFTFRSCWAPHGACDSRSTSHCRSCRLGESCCPRRTTAEVAPGLHAKGPCETTAASRAAASEHDGVPQAERRVQGPAILGSTLGASTTRDTSVPAPRSTPWCQATGTRRWVPFPSNIRASDTGVDVAVASGCSGCDPRVQVPVIPASTPGACGRRLSESIPCSSPWPRRCGRSFTIPGSLWHESHGIAHPGIGLRA